MLGSSGEDETHGRLLSFVPRLLNLHLYTVSCDCKGFNSYKTFNMTHFPRIYNANIFSICSCITRVPVSEFFLKQHVTGELLDLWVLHYNLWGLC